MEPEEPEPMDHQHEESMSPFLPEFENDTLLNDIALYGHHVHEQDTSENISTTKPPTLEFDQLNHTNPHDNDTADAFGVIPLKPNYINENMTSENNNNTSREGKNMKCRKFYNLNQNLTKMLN